MIGERPRLDVIATPPIDLVREADHEQCGALREFWYVACLSTELTRTKPLGRTIMGLPIALFRDERGRACAVRDRCLHRGTALSGGDVVGGKLACPYHGWSYDGRGQCVFVPSLQQAPENVGCLRTFAVQEQDGLVYVCLGARARKDPFPIPYWDHPGWTVYYMVTRFQNGVTNLVENFMDVPHTIYVHRGWFRVAKRQRVPATVERNTGSVLVTYQQERDRISGLGVLLDPSGREPMVHTDKYYIPNITRVDYMFGDRSGFVITSQVTPIGPTDSLVYTAISYRFPFGRMLEKLVRWYTTRVIMQDVDIMREQQRGITRGNEPLTFASTDADLLHSDIEAYRAWLLAGGHGDGPSDVSRPIVFWI